MDRARFQRVKELFQLALTWPPPERAARLTDACGQDAELQKEVEDLLAHAAASDTGFLAAGAAVAGTPFDPVALEVPGFRVLERLGSGGSGTVYRAEQERPRREVALKVLRIDALTPGQVARFEREAAILARLDHPGIARVIQAGVLDDGSLRLPWIALEFVRGSTLDEFVADRRPELGALLDLFVEVCAAVEHAHGQGIVHRDLKPSNVMIDEAGRPRVLDFGTARASEGAAALVGDPAGFDPTRTGAPVGTLAYMAPEQARGVRAIAPSADVYALGVMLFELLTGRLPIALDGLDLMGAVQIACEQDPTPLRRLRPDLPEDLATILAKTLEKEPARRYASAGELAADLTRLRSNRPVLARRSSALYQAQKFVRRNRALTFATVAVVLALATGLGFALASLRLANRQIAASSEVLELFAATLLDLTPKLGFGEEQRGSLEALLGLVERQLEVVPRSHGLRAARARLAYELASLDQVRGDFTGMRARLETARESREELTREDPADLESWTRLSQVYAKLGEAARDLGDPGTRDAWFARALALDERLVREHPGDPELLEDLGWSLERVAMVVDERGEHDEAFRLRLRRFADAEDLVRREPGNWKYVYNLTNVHFFLAGHFARRGEHEACVQHARECVRIARELHELQRDRRDFLEWLTHAYLGAVQRFSEAGLVEEARLHAKEALVRAQELALGDPRREQHIELLCVAAGVLARLQRGEGDTAGVRETVERLRGLALQFERSGATEPAPLLAQAAAIEAGS